MPQPVEYPPELEPQLRQVAALRAELRAVRGAIELQRPRIAAYRRRWKSPHCELNFLACLCALSRERRTLEQLRASSHDIDSIAEAISREARDTLEVLAREQLVRPLSLSTPMQLGGATRPPHSSADRSALLAAAQERMSRRGVPSHGYQPRSLGLDTTGPQPNMFERIRTLQISRERADAPPRGEPVVEELQLLRPLAEGCSICLEPRRKGDSVWILKCGHCFHARCASKWLHKSELLPDVPVTSAAKVCDGNRSVKHTHYSMCVCGRVCGRRLTFSALSPPRRKALRSSCRRPLFSRTFSVRIRSTSSHAITFRRVRLVSVIYLRSVVIRYSVYAISIVYIATSLLPQVEGVTTRLRRGRSPRAATADTIKRRAPLCARSSCVPLHIPSITLQIMLATLAAQNFRAWKSLHRVSGAI